MSSRPRRRISLLVTAALVPLLGAGLGLGQGAAAAAPRERPARPPAVALGDSFAAGEGLAPYVDGTDTATNRCHRSTRAYPALLAETELRRFRSVLSVACSSATTADVVADVPGGSDEPAQVDALTRRTRTVTLTVGGNDIGFAPVLADCVYTPVALPEVQALVSGRPGCAARQDEGVTARTARLAGRAPAAEHPGTATLPRVLRTIHRRAPKARIYVTGYPRLFGLTFPSPTFGCPVGQLGQVPLFVTADDARWVRSKADGLNAAIESSVERARRQGIRATYVDVATPFTSHNVCGTGDDWVNGVVFNPTNPPSLATASFHPTARGQQAYADAIAAAAGGRSRS